MPMYLDDYQIVNGSPRLDWTRLAVRVHLGPAPAGTGPPVLHRNREPTRRNAKRNHGPKSPILHCLRSNVRFVFRTAGGYELLIDKDLALRGSTEGDDTVVGSLPE